MPTATFLNLPKEKQTKILNAAKHEFGKNPVEEASVKNIVTEAEIPRGSFYAYFHDKEDLYHYILEEYRTQIRSLFYSCLERENNHIFDAFILFHNEILKQCQQANLDHFLTNSFLNMRSGIHAFLPVRKHEVDKEYMASLINDLKQTAHFDKLNIQNEQEFQYILEILTTLTRSNIAKALGANIPFEEACNMFLIKINLLKRGMEK